MPRSRFEINNEAIAKLVKADKKKFVRYKEGAILYSMGMHMFEKIAKDAGAVYHVNRMVLINTEIVDAYLERFRDSLEEQKTE